MPSKNGFFMQMIEYERIVDVDFFVLLNLSLSHFEENFVYDSKF